jgi:AcrR family transcriptional regulator
VDAGEPATVERVLAAAEDEFGRAGLDGAKLADIAKAAGITRPSLLYHFASKDALYGAVVDRAFGRLGRLLEGSMGAPLPFAERLEATVRAYLGFLDEHPALAAVVLRELLDARGPGRRILLERIVPLLKRVEQFVRDEGGEQLSPSLPIRGAILAVVTSALVRRSATEPLRDALWGRGDPTLGVALHLFLRRPIP